MRDWYLRPYQPRLEQYSVPHSRVHVLMGGVRDRQDLVIVIQVRPAKRISRKAQKTGLNRSILDVGMGALRAAIEYKLAEAGGIFVEIPTQKVKPSQTCPQCGSQKKKELSERIHSFSCGFTCDRDVAAAQVMLNWAMGLGTSLNKRG